MNPIFIFSLPRSGSTLLQRILSNHQKITSTAEPWLLLPLINMRKLRGTLSEYSSEECSKAINDFIKNSGGGEAAYELHLKTFVSALYSQNCLNNELYFIDKTPRYYLIIDDIVRLFPNAKFIFIFRNPIDIISSMLSTWANGRINKTYLYENDITTGLTSIAKAYDKYKDISVSITYENFTQSPNSDLIRICNYLEIEYDSEMEKNLKSTKFSGRMGDPTGIHKYNSIKSHSQQKWKKTLNSNIKRRYIKSKINKVSEEALSLMSYEKQEILESLNEHTPPRFIRESMDALDAIYSEIIRKTNAKILFGSEGYYKNLYLS